MSNNLFYDFCLQDNPSMYLALDETPSNRLQDSLDRWNTTPTYVGGVYTQITGPVAPNHTGIQISGSSYIEWYDGSGTNLFKPITGDNGWAYEFWIKPNNPTATYCSEHWTGGGTDIYLGLGDMSGWNPENAPFWDVNPPAGRQVILTYAYNNAGWKDEYIYSPVLSDDWHHIVATLSDDGTTISLYVDGTLSASKVLAINGKVTWRNLRDYLMLASWSNGQTQLDEFVIYDHTLTPERILLHYVLLKAGYAQAQAEIGIPVEDGLQLVRGAQAQVSIKALDVLAQGQAQALIKKITVYGQAQARIIIPSTDTSSFRGLAIRDGAVAYYGMNRVQSYSGFSNEIAGRWDIPYYYYGYYQNTNVDPNHINAWVDPEATSSTWYYAEFFRQYNASDIPFNNQPQWSIEFWLQPRNNETYSEIWSLYESTSVTSINLRWGALQSGTLNTAGTHFYVAEGYYTSRAIYDGGDYPEARTGPNYPWYHIAITSNNGVRKLYVNGQLKQTWTGVDRVWTSEFLGYDGATGVKGAGAYKPNYDDIAIYQTELTQSQIASHILNARFHMGFGQAHAYINMSQQTGLANADIYQTYKPTGMAHAYINMSQQTGFAQTWTYVYGGGAQARNQAKANARAQIRTPGVRKYGQAQALIQPRDGLLAAGHNSSAYAWTSITGYYTENAPNEPSYGDGNYGIPASTPPVYNGPSNFGLQWWGNFTADITGTWQFLTNNDDAVYIYIWDKLTKAQVSNLAIGCCGVHGPYGVDLVAGRQYSMWIGWGQGGGPWGISLQYKRPNETAFSYLTDNNPPWIDVGRKLYTGQANAMAVYINPETGATIWPKFGQATLWTKVEGNLAPAQAQASIQKYHAPTVGTGLNVNRAGTITIENLPNWPNFPSGTMPGNVEWTISAHFFADVSGTWSFNVEADYEATVTVGTTEVLHAYYYDSPPAGKTGTIDLVAGQDYRLYIWWRGDGTPNALRVLYKRPDGVFTLLTNDNPPWLPIKVATGQAQVYISPSFDQNAFGQAITQIKPGQAGYRRTVLSDNPVMYFPLDEEGFTTGRGTNLIRLPGTTYSAFYSNGNPNNYYSATYSPDKAADGNLLDGWAGSGYRAGDWWQVNWSSPQNIRLVTIYNRASYTFGYGRIIFSDGSSYSVTFPSIIRAANQYQVNVTGVTWMKIISDGGGNSDPGLGEVEAYETIAPLDLVRYPIGGTATYSASSQYHDGNYNADKAADGYPWEGWASEGWTTGQWWQVNWTVPQDFQSVKVISRPGDTIGSGRIILSNGTSFAVNWPPGGNYVRTYLVGGKGITWMRLTSDSGGSGNPGFAEVEVFDAKIESGVAKSIVGRAVGTWSEDGAIFGGASAANSGSSIDFNGHSINIPFIGESYIKTPGPVSLEFWINWNGNEAMPFGFDGTDLYLNSSWWGFNAGGGQIFGAPNPGANKWVHVVAIIYPNDLASKSKLYFNGVAQTMAWRAGGDFTFSMQNYLRISGWSSGSYRMGGQLDEFAVYNYELTGAQVLAHYSSRVGFQHAQVNTLVLYRNPDTGAYIWPQPAQAQAKLNAYGVLQPAQAQALVVGNAFLYSQDKFVTSTEIYTEAWPNYPVSNYYNWDAVVRFTADADGTWNFRISVDDAAYLVINGTDVIRVGITGQGSYRTGSYTMQNGQQYNMSLGLYNSDYSTEYLVAQYQRPGDSTWYYLTENKAPWAKLIRATKVAQAKAQIVLPPHTWQYAQAQANIRGIRTFVGLANADIKQTYRKSAQALALLTWRWGMAQSNVWVRTTSAQFGLARVVVGHFQHAQAQVYISPAFDQVATANAKAQIKRTNISGYGQAIVQIGRGYGQAYAQADIRQTYPLRSCDVNLVWGVSASNTSVGQPSDVLDHNEASWWGYSGSDIVGQTFNIDLGNSQSVNGIFIQPIQCNATVSLQKYIPGVGYVDVITGIYFDVTYLNQVDRTKSITLIFDPQEARYWRLLVTDGGIFTGIGIAELQLGQFSVKNGTYAQATVQIGFFWPAQAQAYILPGVGTQIGQARTHIVNTYEGMAQSEAFIIPPHGSGQALADILVYDIPAFAQAQVWALPPTVCVTAQALILVHNVVNTAQANADVLHHDYGKPANALAWIHVFLGSGNAQAVVRQTGMAVGQARVSITGFHFGQAMALIAKIVKYGQANADIKQKYYMSAGAMTLIVRRVGHAHVMADIKQTYEACGNAQVVVNTHWKMGFVQIRVRQTYLGTGQAQADIYQTYDPIGFAQAVIYFTVLKSGNAEALIVREKTAIGQAMTQVGYFKYGQAQAKLNAYGVLKTGNAVCYILGSQTYTPTEPTSDRHTYLVRYNDYDLPGYAQEEQFENGIRLTTKVSPYVWITTTTPQGYDNWSITLRMLLWEPTYADCKRRLQEAVTMLRSTKGWGKLFIQRRNQYYLAKPVKIMASKNANEGQRTLEYLVTFEVRPEIIQN